MPRRELKHPAQIEEWLIGWGQKLKAPGKMILIGSGALLWHAAQRGIETPLPENSMDVDPITHDDEVAELCYEGHIGSPFERENGWHINLMPDGALDGLPLDWENRSTRKSYNLLTVEVPAPEDLLAPKTKRGEPRDLAHHQWAVYNGLISR
jgi:S-formylglutathione hydrolase FrmB